VMDSVPFQGSAIISESGKYGLGEVHLFSELHTLTMKPSCNIEGLSIMCHSLSLQCSLKGIWGCQEMVFHH